MKDFEPVFLEKMNNYGGGAPETASKFAHPPREQKPYEPRHKEGYIGKIR